MEELEQPLFRLRLGSGRLVGSPAWGTETPPGMWNESAGIELTVAGHTVVAPDGDIGRVLTAVSLLRTVFENHEVDYPSRSSLFFNGCAINTYKVRYDFSVTHLGDAVLLSDFTFLERRDAEPVRVPLHHYAEEVATFARQVQALPVPRLAEWADRVHHDQRSYLGTLLELVEAFVTAGCRNRNTFYAEFVRRHGSLKRPLEMELLAVLTVGDKGPAIPAFPASRAHLVTSPLIPWVVEARVLFGPISTDCLVPVRINHGDVVLVRAIRFSSRGAVLTAHGVGDGGVAPGDRLRGLQLFYA